MEASLEHMSRSTVRSVDVLVVITEPYYRSLETAGRLVRLARQLAIPRIVAVANKIRTEDEEQAVRTYLSGVGVELAGIIPYDDAVRSADAGGAALLDASPDSSAVAAIAGVADEVLPR